MRHGFTLIELLICIIGLAAVAAIITAVCIGIHFLAKFW